MAVTVKGTINDGVRGGKVEFGTFTIDPASINAASEAESTLTLDGVATGDLVFVNPHSLTAHLVAKGARVTAADTIGVTLYNSHTAAVDGGSITYDYIVVKFS